MSDWIQDLRYGLRTLAARPTVTAVTVLSLALGIGANVAIFSVFNAVFLAPLPYPASERLVMTGLDFERAAGGTFHSPHWSYPHYRVLRENAVAVEAGHDKPFSEVAAFVLHEDEGPGPLLLTDAEQTRPLRVEYVSESYFRTLGRRVEVGREFTSQEESTPLPVAILSDHGRRRLFGDEPPALGSALSLSHHPVTIVGFGAPGFEGISGEVDLWLPLGLVTTLLQETYLTNSDYFWLRSVGRLAEGASLETARAALPGTGRALMEALPGGNRLQPTVTPLRDAHVDARIRKPLGLLLAAVSFVFLIACVNVTNLLLAQSVRRRPEIAMRLALGAGRGRLTRQFLTEGTLLGVAGGLVGLAIAAFGLQALQSALPATSGTWTRYAQAIRSAPLDIDIRVGLFTLALSLLAVPLFGLFPAVRSTRLDLRGQLARGAVGRPEKGLALRRWNGRNLLVTAQLALALVLLVGASLMIRTLDRMRAADPGFRSTGVLAVHAQLPQDRSSETWRGFLDRLTERLGSTPGIESAGLGTSVPLGGSRYRTYAALEGTDASRTDYSARRRVRLHIIDAGYLPTLGIRLLRGRNVTATDGPTTVLVNRAAAEQFWPGEPALGRRIGVGMGPDDDWAEVVGVVGDVSYGAVEDEQAPEVYLPWGELSPASIRLFVRASGDPAATAAVLRAAAAETDPQAAIYGIRSLDEIASDSRAHSRFLTVLLGTFAGIAVALAAGGVYGVLAFAVNSRRRDFGIRIALGASGRTLLRGVLLDGLVFTVAGVAVGLGASLALARLLQSQLFGVTPLDPWALILAVLGLTLVSGLASLIPARRVARLDPWGLLRDR